MADREVTIAASGGDYTSFNAALAGEDDFQAGEDNIVFNKTDNTADTTSFNVGGFSSSASNRILIKGDTSARHDLTRSSGARVVRATDNVITISMNYVSIIDLEIGLTSSTSHYPIYANSVSNIVIDSCLVYSGYASIYLYTGGNNIVANTVVYGKRLYSYPAAGETNYIYNCTVLNSTDYGIRQNGSGTTVAKNCYAGGSGTTDFVQSAGTLTLITCASSDGSLSTTEIELADCGFSSYSSGSEDAHISSSSDLIDEGTDLSIDAVYAITVDFEEDSRDSSPCLGADEYVSGGITSKSDSDSGALTDDIFITASIPLSEDTSGSDSISVKSIVNISDLSIYDDAIRNIKAILSMNDSGSGGDAENEFSNIFDSESLVGVDGIRSVVKNVLFDSGICVDSLSVAVNLLLSDSGSGTDGQSVSTDTSKVLSDSGICVDIVTIRVLLNLVEFGNAVDSYTEKSYIDTDDSGTGYDLINAGANLTISDDGVCVDSIGVMAFLNLLDSGINIDDIISQSPSKTLADYGIFIDSISVVGSSGFVEQIYFKSQITKELNLISTITDTLNFKSVLQ